MLNRLTIRRRLAAAFLLIALLLGAVATIGLTGLRSLNQALEVMVSGRAPRIELLHAVVDETSNIGIALRNALLADDEGDVQAQLKRVEEGRRALGQMLDMAGRDQGGDAEATALQQRLQTEYSSYTVEIVKVTRAIAAGKKDLGRTFLNQGLQPRMTSYLEALRAAADREGEAMARERDAAQSTFVQGRQSILAILALAAVATAALAWTLARSITVPLSRAGAMAEAIAEGDLTHEIEVRGHDETAHLSRALNAMRDRLAATVRRIQHAAGTLNGAAGELARGSHDLSRRTESHASALEETAASVEELTATVRQNAHSAQEAHEIASGASRVAAKGGGLVTDVVQTMSAIEDGSRRIAEIIGLIDGIAFQTNILALNAAVEAARAGEQGRGFAVVAAEVRSLAQRSAAAAQDIRKLIAHSVKSVGEGSERVGNAGTTIEEVVRSVDRVADAVTAISAASKQQSAGIAQVGATVTQMDRMTQENAAMVEELSKAAAGLEQQAAALVEAVAGFRLEALIEAPAGRTDGDGDPVLALAAPGLPALRA